MLIFYAAGEGIGKASWNRTKAIMEKHALLLSYFNVGVNSRQTWVFKKLLKLRK